MRPVVFQWSDDGAMYPVRGFQLLCDRQFVVGERYRLVEEHERSQASHNSYFAALHDAWLNLPEHLVDVYPTETHLRKRALIEAGYFDEKLIPFSTPEEALRVAGCLEGVSDFALIRVYENAVSIKTAKSQNRRSMNAKQFQESKQKVLDIVADMIGVKPQELKDNAGAAA